MPEGKQNAGDAGDVWERAPKAAIAEDLGRAMAEVPEEITVSVTLRGRGAARYHFARTLLLLAFPDLAQEDVDKFLMRAGAEREIERLAHLWSRVSEQGITEQDA